MQKFQRLQPKARCGKFQAPSRVPEEGERSPGAKMLVPGFSDLGPPLTGRRDGEGTGQESLAESREAGGAGSSLLLPMRGSHWSERETDERVLVPRMVLERKTSPSVQRETEAQ